MKSFAILALVGAVAAQEFGACTNLCIDNMRRIVTGPPYSCAEGDTECFCTKSNWAYGLRDCSAEACDAEQAAAAVAYGAAQCAGVEASNTVLPAVPIFTSAFATVTGAAQSVISEIASGIESGASEAQSNAMSVTSAVGGAVSSAINSLESELDAATSSLASEFDSATNAAGSAISSATDAAGSAISSATDAAGSAISSATDAAGSAVESATSDPSDGAAPVQTAAPIMAAAGMLAVFLL